MVSDCLRMGRRKGHRSAVVIRSARRDLSLVLSVKYSLVEPSCVPDSDQPRACLNVQQLRLLVKPLHVVAVVVVAAAGLCLSLNLGCYEYVSVGSARQIC